MLRVLTYHRIANPGQPSPFNPRLISATPETFRAQLSYLSKNYRVVSIHEVLHAVLQGRTLRRNAVLITFDDGYLDFVTVAWPILKEFGMAATLFVPTAYPDHPERVFWWDRLYQAFMSTSREIVKDSPLGPFFSQDSPVPNKESLSSTGLPQVAFP